VKVFVHVGMPKTGSTTIQRTLLRNQGLFAKEGVHYPYRSNFLYGLATGTDPGPPIAIPSGCHTLILSDERLFNRVRSRAAAELIVQALKEISPEVYLLSYVRREDEVFVSAHFTRLLMGGTHRLEDLPLNPIQIHKRLSSWNKPLGRENMIVRRFGRPYLPDGLINDFARAVGIDHLPIVEAAVANSSPRCDVLEIIRLLNTRRGERELDRHALKAIAKTGGFGDPVGLAEEKRRILIDKSAEANGRLSKAYFAGEQVFSHPVADNEPRWPEIGIEELVRVAEKMAEADQVRLGPAPVNLDDALEWMRTLAEQCARRPSVNFDNPQHRRTLHG
jgi:hypothetical protein